MSEKSEEVGHQATVDKKRGTFRDERRGVNDDTSEDYKELLGLGVCSVDVIEDSCVNSTDFRVAKDEVNFGEDGREATLCYFGTRNFKVLSYFRRFRQKGNELTLRVKITLVTVFTQVPTMFRLALTNGTLHCIFKGERKVRRAYRLSICVNNSEKASKDSVLITLLKEDLLDFLNSGQSKRDSASLLNLVTLKDRCKVKVSIRRGSFFPHFVLV